MKNDKTETEIFNLHSIEIPQRCGKWRENYMTKEMDLVMDYEKKQGRNPVDVSNRRNVGCDIKCEDRFIEVKKRDMKYDFVFITENEFQTFLKNKNAYLYVVYYEDGKAKLKIFDRDTVIGNSHLATIRYRIHMRKAIKEHSEEIGLG